MLTYSKPPSNHRTAPISHPKFDPFSEQLDQWLLNDTERHRKHRHTSTFNLKTSELIASLRYTSFVCKPFSYSFSIVIICSAMNRDRFIILSITLEDSARRWRKFRDAGQSDSFSIPAVGPYEHSTDKEVEALMRGDGSGRVQCKTQRFILGLDL